jgi:hypothetical protein
MNEIEWLDKVRQNFSEEQYWKDESRFNNQFWGSGSIVNFTAQSGNTYAVSSLNDTVSVTFTETDSTVNIADQMLHAGIIDEEHYFEALGNPQYVTSDVGPDGNMINVRTIFYDDSVAQLSEMNGIRYLRSIDGHMVECQDSRFNRFSTNSMTWVQVP